MSMNTPTGGIIRTTAIKDFIELEDVDTQQYLLGINNITTGDGSKIKLEKILESSISTDTGNTLEIGSDNKLLNIEEDTGVQAGTYAYPQNLVVNSKGKITSVVSGSPASVPIATPTQAGIVKPDGNTITVASDGTINANILGYEIGDIIIRSTPTNDAGKHLLDGALIQGSGIYSAFVTYIAGLVTDYPNLFITETDWQIAVATYGVCGKFVYDSVNKTVRLPKVTSKIEGTTDVNALGDLAPLLVKLPNITGGTDLGYGISSGGVSLTGAYDVGSGYTGSYFTVYAGGTTRHYVGFDASKSSSVYSGNGSDTKIHEQAIKVLYYIVIATSTKTQIQVDIDEIATDLNGKMDTDGTNAVSSVKFADGQWVDSELTIASAVTWNDSSTETTYSLSNYLPNDGYDYEILISAFMYTVATSGKYVVVELKTDLINNPVYLGEIYARSAAIQIARGNAILPVGSGRYVKQIAPNSTDASGSYSLKLNGYRRLGTNQ